MPPLHRRPIVLLIEDSEDDAFYFRLSLKRAALDCDLIHLTDGAAAITYLQGCAQSQPDGRVRPDMVFLDLKVPTRDGFEILKWIREQGLRSVLDVAVLSGSENADDMKRAAALGASDYIVKPVQRPKLAGRFAAWHKRQDAAPAPNGHIVCPTPQGSG